MDEKSYKPRRYARYPTNLDVVIHVQPEPIHAHLLQLSRGGCQILPALPPQPTPFVKMSFRLSQELPSIDCVGEIIYSIEGKGTGIALSEISEENQEMISTYFENLKQS
jgi:PilZ domain